MESLRQLGHKKKPRAHSTCHGRESPNSVMPDEREGNNVLSAVHQDHNELEDVHMNLEENPCLRALLGFFILK
jgi:hypothetical protein